MHSLRSNLNWFYYFNLLFNTFLFQRILSLTFCLFCTQMILWMFKPVSVVLVLTSVRWAGSEWCSQRRRLRTWGTRRTPQRCRALWWEAWHSSTLHTCSRTSSGRPSRSPGAKSDETQLALMRDLRIVQIKRDAYKTYLSQLCCSYVGFYKFSIEHCNYLLI